MTIAIQERVAAYLGNSAATVFPFTFPIFESAHLEVRLYTVLTNTYVVLSSTDYTTTGIGPNSSGGTITYNPGSVPIPSTKMLVIYRTLPYTQDTDIVNQSGFYPEVIERQLDKIVMQIQQLAESLGRTVTLPPTSSASDEDFVATVLQLAGQQAQLDLIAAWISGGSNPGILDITGFVFATAGQTSIPVAGGYTPGAIEIRRNGIVQLQGGVLGTGDTDFDCTATDGTTITFPASEIDLNDCISWTKKRNFDIGLLSADAVSVTAPLGDPNVQVALETLTNGKVSTTRQITTGGLLTGGGALNADRAFAVPKSSNAQAIAGIDDTTAMTPVRVKDAVQAFGGSAGLVFLQGGGFSGASLSLALGTTYRRFSLKVRKIEPVTSGAGLISRVAVDGVPTYIATGGAYKFSGMSSEENAAIVVWNSGGGANEFQLGPAQLSASGNPGNLDLEIENSGPGNYSSIQWRHLNRKVTTSNFNQVTGQGYFLGSSARWTHLNLLFTAGSIATGAEYALYAFKEN